MHEGTQPAWTLLTRDSGRRLRIIRRWQPSPRFFLFGEPPHEADERFFHIETIADRSRLYDWKIRPHTHRDLHQLLVHSRRRRRDAGRKTRRTRVARLRC